MRVTLKPAFVKTLTPGSHTLTALFDDGAGEATFTIKKASDNHNDQPDRRDNTGGRRVIPSTSDLSVPPMVIALVAGIGVGVLAIGIVLRRRGRR